MGLDERVDKLEETQQEHGKYLAILCRKIDNGWAGNIDENIKFLQLNQHDIKLTVNSIQHDVAYLKERPRARSLIIKDAVLIITALGAIVGMSLQIFGG